MKADDCRIMCHVGDCKVRVNVAINHSDFAPPMGQAEFPPMLCYLNALAGVFLQNMNLLKKPRVELSKFMQPTGQRNGSIRFEWVTFVESCYQV